MPLPEHVVSEDHRLEEASESAAADLAAHRWRWTLDELNPERVSLREYARQVARSKTAIAKHAKGYGAWLEAGTSDVSTLNEYIERAALGADREAVVEAVAAATDRAFSTARRDTATVNDVLATARERAEANGTTVAEEAAAVAERREKARQASQRLEAERRERHGLRYIEAEGKLAAVERKLAEAGQAVEGVELSAEELEALRATVERIPELAAAIVGHAGSNRAIARARVESATERQEMAEARTPERKKWRQYGEQRTDFHEMVRFRNWLLRRPDVWREWPWNDDLRSEAADLIEGLRMALDGVEGFGIGDGDLDRLLRGE